MFFNPFKVYRDFSFSIVLKQEKPEFMQVFKKNNEAKLQLRNSASSFSHNMVRDRKVKRLFCCREQLWQVHFCWFMLSFLFWLPLLCPIMWFRSFIQVFLLCFCLPHVSSRLRRSDGSFDRSLAPPAPLCSFSFCVSISGFLVEFPGRRLAPENNHQTVVRALNRATHTHTHSLCHVQAWSWPCPASTFLTLHSLSSAG